ncbi:MAG: cytochrome c3 family protein [Acidobacteriota bacterium]|nr:cytochrome c3 family protein [Acidobacteriota bacterium]
MKKQESEPYPCWLSEIPLSEAEQEFSLASVIKAFIRFILLSIIVLVSFCFASAQKKDSCVECHTRLGGKLAEPVEQFKDNIHKARGLSCNDCHGGDPNQDDKRAAKDPLKGYTGKPKPNEIPGFCAKCHADADLMKRFNPSLRVDQEREYLTSIHGQRLKAGDQKVATCVSCHGVHNIRAVTDPLSSVYASNVADTCAKCHANADYMKGYNIPTDQFNKYKTSVHAKALYEKQDLSAPTCNDCHGNHGAAPPGLASVANVCGQCHVRQAELFQTSPHKAKFDEMQLGECIRCHNNHDIMKPSDEMIGTGQKSVCTSCHKEGDKGFVAAGRIRSRLDELSNGINSSDEILDRAERKGMEVSRPKFEMREAVDALTHARVLIHTSSPEEVDKVIGPGLEVSKKGYVAGVMALDEMNFRRKGLVVSLVFILFLATLVYLKVREIERRQQPA